MNRNLVAHLFPTNMETLSYPKTIQFPELGRWIDIYGKEKKK